MFYNAMSAIKGAVMGSNEKNANMRVLEDELRDRNERVEVLQKQLEVFQALLPAEDAQKIEDEIQKSVRAVRRRNAMDKLRGQLTKVNIQISMMESKRNDIQDQIDAIDGDPLYCPE